MEQRREIVGLVAGIWRNHRDLETLYKTLMGMDISRSFRRLCTNGHMSSLVCKKEMMDIYESFKCNLSDSDIEGFLFYEEGLGLVYEGESETVMALMLRQKELIAMYERASDLLWHDAAMVALCRDHQEQLLDLNRSFAEHTLLHQSAEYSMA